MERSHFRLKIDLSKFFHDARRFCWIFVDGTKIQQIIHMKEHISKLFNIAEPFHLLLNDTEYLPPIEDVRILKEDETILIVPGSGISNEIPAIIKTRNDFMCDKEAQTINSQDETGIVVQNMSKDILNNTESTPINIVKDTTVYSVINDTMVDYNEEDIDFKSIDNNLTKDCNMIESIISISKRKRVRKRKPKNQSQLVSSFDTSEENILKESESKKPKIIDSYIIPSKKHIRFNNMENDKNNIAKEISTDKSYLNKASSKDFSTLLTLEQSSTPITFVNEKLKNGIKTESILNDEIKDISKSIANRIEKNLCNTKFKKEIQNDESLYVELQKIPIITRKPQINDIIAFKTLKIGADYTPQMSNFILTEVLRFCTQSENYTLQILYGREEVQVPFGKFSVSEDESESHSDEDTFILNYSQMKELRIIS